KTAKAHCQHGKTGDQEADGHAGQDRVTHCVAHEAKTAEHEEHPDRRRAERKRKAAHQRAAHEGEVDEGIDDAVHHAEIRSLAPAPRSHTSACSSQASVSWRAAARCLAVSTCLVGPQAMTSRASRSVLGKWART